MSFPTITTLVPKDEHFDATALNEGIWLSEGHLVNVESALVDAAANNTQQTTRINELSGQLTAAQASLTEAQNNLATANTTVSTLQGEIAELKKQPAVPLSQTPKEGVDETPGGGTQLSEITKEANEIRKLKGLPPIK
jgi:uncharacterized protein YkwD